MLSDAQVFRNVIAEFKSSRVLHYLQLSLLVEDGVVTISGRVNSLTERTAVERAAKRAAGIKTLIIEITAAAIPSVRTTTYEAGSASDGSVKAFG